MFTGPGLLTLADLLPVMTAFVDRETRYRFINKPLAEWLGRSRRDMIGRTMEEVLGPQNFAERKPMVEAALAGERKFFAATFDHPERGMTAAQTDYVPWIDPATGRIDGVVIDDLHHRAALDRTGAAKRRAIPPHRQFRACLDVGYAARSQARFRQ